METQSFLESNWTTLCLFSLTVVVIWTILKPGARGRLPKGPRPLPFFGNLLSFPEHDAFLNMLNELGKEYGPVYTLYLGSRPAVIVNGWEEIKEVTVRAGNDFGDRAESIIFKSVNTKRLGIFDTRADEMWKQHRKFAHTTLRGMGFGKVSLEPLIQEEVNHLVKYFKSTGGSVIDPRTALGVTSSNVICTLVMKRREEHGSDSASELMENVRHLMVGNEGALLTLVPSAWPIMQFSKKWRDLLSTWEVVKKIFNEQIESHQARLDAATGEPEIHDFLDAYLVHRKSDPDTFTIEALHFDLLDLFLAGTDTISLTLSWAIKYLAVHTDVQQKVHDEIKKIVGDQQVSMSHRGQLPYTEATVLEIQRLASVAPIVPRMTVKDTSAGGQNIPEGTEVLLNLWSLHRDPDVWTDPDKFNPERFLEDDGTVVKQPKNFLPFSAGKRVCMGEQLAKMELFLFFTTIMQQVKFSLPPSESVSFEGFMDLTRDPAPFGIQIYPWND
ncbi:cytochrome P450 2U1-like [Diadema antillarum]|uniref:cytochrome P450 2U1-like n=1 Tax=Diadema antillarum TaxID=105358 RepID=UPI003A89C530